MLELSRIAAGYGSSTVLRDVSVKLPEGRVVALLGPNGAGKTTLLRVASGLLKARTGRVLLDGDDVTDHSADRRARAGICHVPEGRGVFPSLTVAENLRIQAARESSLDRALDAFPALAAHRHQPAGTLSGGQQQMLALARVYMASPRFVLIDEASMGLSPRLVDEVFESLERLVAAGAGVLLVEQYVTRALGLADYVYLLNKGHVTFVGEPSEVDADDLFAHYLGGSI